MIDAYRRFSLPYQLIAGAAITLMAYLLSMNSDEALIITAGTAVGLVVLHLFLLKLNSMLAFIVILLQASIMGLIVYGVHSVWPFISDFITLDVSLVSALIIFYSITTSAVYVYLGYKFSRGRLWLNLMTAFIFQSVGIFSVLLYNVLFYVAAFVLGFILGGVYLVLRMPRMKKHPDVSLPLLNKEAQVRAEKLLDNSGLHYMYLPDEETNLVGHYFAWDENSAYLVNVVRPQKSFTVSGHGIQADDRDLIPLMEASLLSINNEKELPSEITVPVMLVLSGFHNVQPVMAVNVSKWKQPDHLLGVTNILTEKGISRFMNASQDKIKPLNTRTKKKLDSFSKKFDVS